MAVGDGSRHRSYLCLGQLCESGLVGEKSGSEIRIWEWTAYLGFKAMVLDDDGELMQTIRRTKDRPWDSNIEQRGSEDIREMRGNQKRLQRSSQRKNKNEKSEVSWRSYDKFAPRRRAINWLNAADKSIRLGLRTEHQSYNLPFTNKWN